jgi:NAD(P)-dependent dehydrogenase (short-subunit alcohol dehydrogenase family)
MVTPQVPIGSGFGAATVPGDVLGDIDLTGKTAIVTGGYSGIGLETVRALASVGATVIVPARDLEKAERNLAGLKGARIAALDLMNARSIRRFAGHFLDSQQPLHILVNNAGMIANTLVRDQRGYESQFSTNHLGHFQLTTMLLPALQKAQGARVVSVSSRGHHHAGVDFDDPHFERRPYDRAVGYGQSKTANALFAVSLDAKWQADGIRAFSLHPGGIVTTGFVRSMTPEEKQASGYLDAGGQPIIDPENNMKTVEQGAATNVWCATSRQLDGLGGVYCENCDVAMEAPADSRQLLGVRPWAIDPERAQRLWALSESLSG